MATPTAAQLELLLDNLQKGDHLALCWATTQASSPEQCAVAYVRVSSKRQLDGAGLRDQWAACQQHAERAGLTLVGLYVDPAISGRRDARPALDQLKRDLRLRRFGTVIFYRVNRIGRNARASYQTAEEVERAGAIVASATETFNRRTAAGNLTFGMLVTVAQFGSDQLSEVMKDTLRNKAVRGEWVGPVPLGYERAGKTLRFSADSDATRRLFERYSTGEHSYMSLVALAREEGFQMLNRQSGQRVPLGREAVRDILRNRAYLGIVTCDDIEYPGQHPALVSQELWDRCAAIREGRASKVGPTTVRLTPAHPILVEIAHCAHCGRRMWARGGGKTSGYRYYRCSGRETQACVVPMVNGRKAEAHALDVLRNLAIPASWREQILQQALALATPTTTSAPQATPEQLQTRLKRLALAWSNGDLDDATYEAERTRLRRQLDQATQALPATLAPYEITAAVDTLSTLGDVLEDATPAQQAALLRHCFSAVWLGEGAVQAITPTRLLMPLMGALWDDGVADGARTRNFLSHSQVLCH